MPFQDFFKSSLYTRDGEFEGGATFYSFTVSDSALPIGGFYASGDSVAEVVVTNTSTANAVLVKAKQGTVGSALNEYSGIYKLEPLESRKFIFGSDMFFALGNYVSGDTATVHISALNATVTEPTAEPDTNHGPENIADAGNYIFGPFILTAEQYWSAPFAFTASASCTVDIQILDSESAPYDGTAPSFDSGFNASSMSSVLGAVYAEAVGGSCYLRFAPTGANLTGVTIDVTDVTEP